LNRPPIEALEYCWNFEQRKDVPMRGNLQIVWLALAGLIAAGLALSWYFSAEFHFAWWHLAGMGLTVLLLALVWLWPGERQPRRPPP
jgi:hypothetical protein